MNLQSLLSKNKVEKIEVLITAVQNKTNKAYSYLNFAKNAAVYSGENEPVYTSVYDAIRIGCESILLFHGYRVKASSEARHKAVIEAAKELAGSGLDSEFQRMQKMRQKRNKLEYGNLTSISEGELKQSIEDAEKLLGKCAALIKSKIPPLGI
ncbi:MAG: hypothetical protein UU95_C0029G0003 [Parcubacteria group bacterium GW2011_GWC2_42_12]|uniref:HEPN domain-containing protein n=1 Tax=Candidatus Falkowbacteria bacterium RIFCSPHIGHO2_02_FULL_42_9 TaxID=1797986 RepID=A0A1F5S9H7_9BACT|nr:MAG: hypothetical protein UU95_C0029G0003 [Parcubacteria group bacterium GW2011_GWC2_42_12]OGF23299.1 MAG: hypothetical protein A3D45_01675 [Candidatus Falkowbacteria bacterium RIFCSPHIGHO2_02_FULL_42_9]